MTRSAKSSRLTGRAMALLGGRKRSALHAPRIAKFVMRWAIRRRSRLAYTVFLSLSPLLWFIALLYMAVTSPPRSGVLRWLVPLQLWLYTTLAGTQLYDRVRAVTRTWSRRR